MKIPRKRLRMSRMKMVAIGVLLALLGSVPLALVNSQPARADVSAPSWWNGDCDVTNNANSYALGASYNGVKACGPRPLYTTQADLTVHFYPSAWGEYEWECVELVMRYMYQVYGIAPYSANGYQVVSNYGGTTLTKVTNNGVSVPSPGDILAFAISDNHRDVGHTAVVTAVSVDGNGTGTVTYMQQNASADGWGSVAVTNKTLGDGISAWLHDPNVSSTVSHTVGDYDGNGYTDPTTWRPSDGVWRSYNGGVTDLQWGWSGDIPVPADYDGDGKTDRATWRPSDGTWHIHMSSGRPDVDGYQWGWSEDIPVPADYDGDGKADIATWRPSTGTWWIDMSSAPNVMGYQWGWSGDIPVPADYDGDGKVDIGTWRPSTGGWWIDMSTAPDINGYQWGWSGDIPVPADYNKDGKADIGTWRPSTDGWWIDMSGSTPDINGYQWGWSTDVPVTGDYDADGYTDIGTWRPSTGQWIVDMSHNADWNPGPQWGWSSDIPAVSTLNRRILQGLGLRPPS